MQAAPVRGILHKPGEPQFLNPAMLTLNTFEIAIPQQVIDDLRPFAREAQAMETPREVFTLSNGVRLYSELPGNWASDIRWLSHADEPSYRWFEAIYDRIGLAAMVAPFVPHDETIRLYAGFLVTRRRCDALDMHSDWATEANHAFTLMAPLTENAGEMGMTFENLRGEQRELQYRLGKGLVFGTRFPHSTSVGQLPERSVFLCFNFGTDRMDHWQELGATTGTQGNFFRQPDGSFVTRAEWLAAGGKPAAY